MKALITGASGFIGSAVVERLLARGERDLRCLIRPGSPAAHLGAMGEGHDGAAVEVRVGNLAVKADAERALEGVSVVYHLAAGMRGAPADMFMNSVVASKNLLEAVVKQGKIKIVLVSSISVYGLWDLPVGGVVDEQTPLETQPERRDVYSHTKVRQEQLFWDYQKKHGFPLVVLRPGVVYGPRGGAIASKVGMDLFGVFLDLGGKNELPLNYVDNCAEAVALAGQSDAAVGEAYNVIDDDLPTCTEYLTRYRREVKRLRPVRIPYTVLQGISKLVERYSAWSEGQLPPVFTPYKVAAMWKDARFDNRKLKGLGWRPIVSTEEGLARTFSYLKRHPA